MIILVGSKIDQSTIHASLGKSEYSYFFLLKEFLPALEQIGQVIAVKDTDEVVALTARYRAEGKAIVFLSFSPPHQVPLDLPCPTVAVFAWEFDSLPSISAAEAAQATPGDWHSNPRNDWSHVFARVAGTIATSCEAAALVERSGDGRFPVIALPAPIWARYDGVCPEQGWPLDMGQRSFPFAGQVIDSRTLKLDPESVAHRPYSEAKRISKAMLKGWWHEVRLPKAQAGAVKVEALPPTIKPVEVDGIVYTSVLNPADGRKNWVDLLSAFCWAFRDEPKATLVLKMTHNDMDLYRGTLLNLLARLSPFRCRVLVLHGFLEDPQYLQLIKASSYYVNASSGEGLCIPLMEFLCCGKPAIAPAHTAMADYLSTDFAFLVGSCLQITDWPHDPSGLQQTHSHRLNWESLMQAYRASYAVSSAAPRYQVLSQQAREHLRNFCSLQRVSGELGPFLQRAAASSVGRESQA
jgi:glycosyltransferase involved in cell wall biosynthesis